MNEERYVLVYRHPEDDTPTSIRTWTLDAAQHRRQRLDAALKASEPPHGRWTIHQLSDEITP